MKTNPVVDMLFTFSPLKKHKIATQNGSKRVSKFHSKHITMVKKPFKFLGRYTIKFTKFHVYHIEANTKWLPFMSDILKCNCKKKKFLN